MIYNFSKIKISTGIKKALFLLISFFIYGFIYFLFCDDHEFGGINILQDEIKKKFVDKYITKVKDGNINSYTKGKLGEKIQTGDVSHKKDKSLTTHLDNKLTNLNDNIIEKNNYQKLFDRFYFSIMTGTTVGYGDIYPVSNKVKIISVIQMMTTIYIILV